MPIDINQADFHVAFTPFFFSTCRIISFLVGSITTPWLRYHSCLRWL
jgi:hypothetical protein